MMCDDESFCRSRVQSGMCERRLYGAQHKHVQLWLARRELHHPYANPSSIDLNLMSLAAICTNPCQHGGICVLPNTCNCATAPGYIDAVCSTGLLCILHVRGHHIGAAVCLSGCSTMHGSCTNAPGTCACALGWMGTFCNLSLIYDRLTCTLNTAYSHVHAGLPARHVLRVVHLQLRHWIYGSPLRPPFVVLLDVPVELTLDGWMDGWMDGWIGLQSRVLFAATATHGAHDAQPSPVSTHSTVEIGRWCAGSLRAQHGTQPSLHCNIALPPSHSAPLQ